MEQATVRELARGGRKRKRRAPTEEVRGNSMSWACERSSGIISGHREAVGRGITAARERE